MFFLVFSFVCAILFIFVFHLWFVANQISVSIWQLVSLGTISFVYFQIQTPGYPDVLANIFILLAFTFKLDTKAKLSLFVLSLASHEASLFVWFALAFLLFGVKGFIQFLIISGIYILLLLAANDGISGLLSVRQVGETSNLMWIVNYPVREVFGIFFGLKGLWGIVIGAIVYLCIRKNFKEVFQILAILLTGVGADIPWSRYITVIWLDVYGNINFMENTGARGGWMEETIKYCANRKFSDTFC